MSDPVPELVKRGLELAPADRERLVHARLESLNESAASELGVEWEAEIEKRILEYDKGEVKTIDAADVFAKARLLAR